MAFGCSFERNLNGSGDYFIGSDMGLHFSLMITLWLYNHLDTSKRVYLSKEKFYCPFGKILKSRA